MRKAGPKKKTCTIKFDLDTLAWARESAELMGMGYQTFINMVLTLAMKGYKIRLEMME